MIKTVINYITQQAFYGEYQRIGNKLYLRYTMRFTRITVKLEELTES